MNESFSIGRPFGINVRVHVLFLYMAAMLIILGGNPLGTAILLVTLFGLVLLHELGHSLVARHHGIHVIDIVLWPLGGMARMSEIPESPRIEGQVSIAGPLVNLVLALAGMAAAALMGSFENLSLVPWRQPEQATLLSIFVLMNLMLGGFNLLPAFPMDGGRILRAFLARKRSYLEATEIAVRVGRYLALAMIFSVFLPQVNCALPIVGIFVLWTGMRELWAVRARHAFGSPGSTGGPFSPFTGAGPGPAGGSFKMDLGELLRAASQRRASTGGHSRTDEPSGPSDDQGTGGGFSDEELRRLENDPGPLKRPPPE